jgi:hypothetical protein
MSENVVEADHDQRTIHQEMMDKAYELWNKPEENKKMPYEDFLETVSEELGNNYVDAVITGNMNYQVENGGWFQWYDNGYSVTIQEIIDFFEKPEFNDCSEIKKLREILSSVEEQLDWKERGDREIQQVDYDFRDIFENALNEEFDKSVDRLDSQYYVISKKVMDILENYFCQKNLNEINGESNK